MTKTHAPDHKYTRRQFLIMRSLQRGATWDAALQAVTKYLTNNPDVDSEEARNYMEWERERI